MQATSPSSTSKYYTTNSREEGGYKTPPELRYTKASVRHQVRFLPSRYGKKCQKPMPLGQQCHTGVVDHLKSKHGPEYASTKRLYLAGQKWAVVGVEADSVHPILLESIRREASKKEIPQTAKIHLLQKNI